MKEKKDEEKQRDRRQVHKLSSDEKTTEEQLNNATSPHSSLLYSPLPLLGVLNISILLHLLVTWIYKVIRNRIF